MIMERAEELLLPPGPALMYVHSDSAPGGPVITQVDDVRIAEGGPMDEADARRERMILRALLNQALWLLGPEEGEY
jgi:hypothetical protein